MEDTYIRSAALVAELNSAIEDVLQVKYGALLPGMAQSVVDFACGQQSAHPGLALWDRFPKIHRHTN